MRSTENSSPRVEEKNSEYRPSEWFFNKEVIASVLLLVSAIAAAVVANSRFHDQYEHLLHLDIAFAVGHFEFSNSLLHWVNDGLMALFFFTVGLEIKREILVGELASRKLAMLPIVAAAGGMLVPGLIYAAFNWGKPGMAGWGIPVATDIAFSLGAIAILGSRLPVGLRIFLSAFAIADDLGAVLIIAIFYTKTISMQFLVASFVCLAILLVANILWVRWIPFYVLMGIITWVCVFGSGVHATVAGVAVAMLVPARGKYDMVGFIRLIQRISGSIRVNRDIDGYWFSIFIKPEHLNSVHAIKTACNNVETPLQRLEHALLPSVTYFILPLFAFLNAGLTFQDTPLTDALFHPVTLGCLLGLLIGKPIGITAASYLAVRYGVAKLPINVNWNHIIGASMLGGIGFTMSLFISGLSFVEVDYLNYSKLGIFAGSIMAAVAGLIFLGITAARSNGDYIEQ